MRRPSSLILTLAALAGLAAAAACSADLATKPSSLAAGMAPVTLRLASTAAPTAGTAASLSSDFSGPWSGGGSSGFGDFGDGMGHHWRGWWGWMHRPAVDSLIVTVTKVEVLAAIPDTEDAADSVADSVAASSGRHGDDDDGPFDWEQREFGWTDLAISGSGHLDLIHLPDSTAAGLTVASGSLPEGTYRHVRLFVTSPMIYFDSTIVTPAGDTLQAGVGYPVVIPSCDSTGAAIRTDEPFVVPAGGGDVQLYFDADDTVRHIIITGSGTIIVPPVIR
jgi:Domain of unknown function (DUF4382)